MIPTVVLVNYNSGHALADAVRALRQQTRVPHIIIVDNASTDDSLSLAHQVDSAARIYPLRHNTGFAHAFNYGVARTPASSSVVIALNPDTMPDQTFVEAITTPLEQDGSLASVAGTLTFSAAPQIIASAGITVHRNGVAIDALLGESLGQQTTPTPVFGASGGAAAYRIDAFRAVGGMCDAFFMYLEDVDLAWRLRLRGWDAVWSPLAVARHDYSAAAGEGSPFKRRLLARNRIWTLARCLPAEIWARDRRGILAFDVAVAGSAAVRCDLASFRGRFDALLGLPIRLRERDQIQSTAVVSSEVLGRWLSPALGPTELLRLRRLTYRFSTHRWHAR